MGIVTYVDTWGLREFLAKKPTDRKRVAHIFARLESGDYDVKVPQIVIGEAVTTAMRDYGPGEWEEPVRKMLREVERVADPGTCFPPPDPEAAELAAEIMANVEGMTRTDAFVAAQTLLDPMSQKLITNDSVLQNAAWLTERERQMRRDGKRIKRLKIGPDA